ncbi:hypothetical protein GALL_495800 [mine drainage metagenome]|uniref:Uncharacterized protein n=1 Tax=mine drainage metagenome TaxID=410659 RepID=A0A1J5PM01_9ZZZZ
MVPIGIGILTVVERKVLDQRLAPDTLARLTRTPDRLVAFLARGMHDIQRHPRHVGDHDSAIGCLALYLRRARIGVRLGPGVAVGQQPARQFSHNVAVLGMHQRQRPQLGATTERSEHLVIVHHQATFIGHEVLECVNSLIHNGFHFVKDLLAPPGNRHVVRIIAVRPPRFVVPHLQRIQQALARRRQGKVDHHRRPPRQSRSRPALEIIAGIGAHERHLKVRMRVDPPRHHVAAGGVQHCIAHQSRSDRGDLAALDQHIGLVGEVGGDDGSVLDDRGHIDLPLEMGARPFIVCPQISQGDRGATPGTSPLRPPPPSRPPRGTAHLSRLWPTPARYPRPRFEIARPRRGT